MAARPSTPTSPEARAFRRHLDRLMQVIQPSDIIPFGVKLFAKEVISHNVNQVVADTGLGIHNRIQQMLMAVFTKLTQQPELFQTVLDVLRQEIVYRDVADAIEHTYNSPPGK